MHGIHRLNISPGEILSSFCGLLLLFASLFSGATRAFVVPLRAVLGKTFSLFAGAA